jgi:poly(3-hydroxyalkanoate) synthetase
MNEAEIRWIVEQLFVGNKLARGEAALEPGRFVNIKAIRAPIIVFASHGDNITPPQQALSWIVDAYASEEEIRLAASASSTWCMRRSGISASSSPPRSRSASTPRWPRP